MIDFRYHLVSLVSVFIALALGIILGAGPLQNSIGTTLEDQVNDLRTSRNEERQKNQELSAQKEYADAALAVAGDQLIPGMMTGRAVAVITVPGLDDAVYEGIHAKLEASGAHVSVRVSLTENFADADSASYRKALASNMTDTIEGYNADSEPARILAGALNTIARKGTDDPQVQSLIPFFTASETDKTLATFSTETFTPADAVLFIVPSISVDSEAGELKDKNAEQARKAFNEILVASASEFATTGPTVVAGDYQDGSALATLRANGVTSTVDSLGTMPAQYNTAFALAAEISGGHTALGSGEGASSPFGTRVDVGVQ